MRPVRIREAKVQAGHIRTALLLFVLVSLGAELGAAPPAPPPPVVETNFFVLPNKAIGGATETPRAADFRATVGKEAYEVRSVSRAADWKDLKTIVVFDLASTAPESRACLIAQAKLVAPILLKQKNVELFVVSSERTPDHQQISYPHGTVFEYFLPEPGTETTDPCSPLPPPKGKFESGLSWDRDPVSWQAFRGLAEKLKTERGPVRVFLVSQGFLWFYVGMVTPMKGEVLRKIDEHIAYSPNAAYSWTDEITRAGINVSPIS
jgi:hypothetical protein